MTTIKCIKCGQVLREGNTSLIIYGACYKCFKNREEVVQAFEERKKSFEEKINKRR